MASNNENKTELLHVKSRFKKSSLQLTCIEIDENTVYFSKSVRNLGIMFDEHMKMDVQIAHMAKGAYAVIRPLAISR